jgi:predicted AAA+ superfamily ATPase
MKLHPVLLEKLSAALEPAREEARTRRDVDLPPLSGKVHAVIGMRRTGKSTFLCQLVADWRAVEAIPSAVYVSFEDERLAGIDASQLDLLLEEYYRRQPATRGRETVRWFLDEVQEVPGWERFVRRVLDDEQVEVTVSGSSAKLLSRELHTSLRGRGLATVIRPFSFREYLRHRHEEPEQPPERWPAALRSRIERRFLDYLVEGGFPEAQGLSALWRVELLQGYVETVVFRDIVERHGVTQVAALRWLVRHALRNPCRGLSAHGLHRDLRSQGHAVGKDTVHELLGYVFDAFLLSEVRLATESERQRNSNPRRVYPADPALIGAFDASGRANLGHALETAVLCEAERRHADVGYVKTREGFEVDFLARYRGGGSELLQVCADPSDEATLARELRSLGAASRELPDAPPGRLLVLTRDQAVPLVHAGVDALPAYEWMLARSRGGGEAL